MMKLSTPQEVLDFWFADTVGGAVETIDARMRLWFFRACPEFDAVQLENADLVTALVSGNIWDVNNDPKALMAKVIVLDQFSRSVFRGSARAFAADEIAADCVRLAAEKGWYALFSPIERFFLCVCLQHSEQISSQELGLSLALAIADGADDSCAGYFAGIKGFPHEHHDVVKRFGRFPHRNEALGRQSTEEELMWLQSDTCPVWAKSQQKQK